MDLFLFHKAIDNYLAGTATTGEQKLVEAYWERFSAEDLNTLSDADRQRLREAIHDGVYRGIRHSAPVVPFYKKKFFRVAAAVLIICLAAATYYTVFKAGADSETTIIAQNDIAPANENATLTLADGRVILLDSSANGAIKGDKGINIVKKDGDVIYSGAGTAGEILFNTLSTARGRNYHLKLSDGTEVWLDAMSSIKYPAVFTGNERKVEVSGQAYFEIAKDSKKPFIVTLSLSPEARRSGRANTNLEKHENRRETEGGLQIQVLGTAFNINTYSTPITTLISGSIKLSASNKSVILKPLQQSTLSNGSLITNEKINIDIITAWRQNQFRFDGSNIKEIMTEVSRWYDIEVEYKDNISEQFVAKISRNVPLSKLLDLLQMTNQVKFNINGNRVTVLKP